MRLRRDERGQSTVIGAILIFGIIILSMTQYQTFVVPQQNEEIEFNAYLDASQDMQRLHGQIQSTGTRGGSGTTVIQTGANYPNRALFVNPPPPTGTISTTPAQNITLSSNLTTVDSAESNLKTFWNGRKHNYSTRYVNFRPAYNEIDMPPIQATGNAVYRVTDGGTIATTAQSVITNHSITIITIEGNISTTRYSTSITTKPVSTSTQSITVGNTTGDFNVTLPTPGNASAWNRTAVADAIRDIENVKRITVLDRRQAVNITFDGSAVYELRLARVSVHVSDHEVDEDNKPPAKYIVTESGNGSAISKGQTIKLTAEVRDRFNNPVSGATVSFAVDEGSGTFETQSSVITSDDGQASVMFTPDKNKDVKINATITGVNNNVNTTTFKISVGKGKNKEKNENNGGGN